ncbi:AAA ATPase cdc48, partial [Massospora cicadina]
HIAPEHAGLSGEGSAERIVTSFLTELDGLFAHEGGQWWFSILRPGRLDIHLPIPLPNLSQRVSILRGKLGPRHNLSDLQLGRLASLTEGFSGADLENICQGAALSTLRSNPEASEVNGLRYIMPWVACRFIWVAARAPRV